MTLASTKSSTPRLARAIVQHTRERTHGPATRLISPSGLGKMLKPFVFLDLFDHEGAPFNAELHPHSGIATLTYVVEGEVSYIDPDNVRGTVPAGGVEWMQANAACGTAAVSTEQVGRAASSCGSLCRPNLNWARQ